MEPTRLRLGLILVIIFLCCAFGKGTRRSDKNKLENQEVKRQEPHFRNGRHNDNYEHNSEEAREEKRRKKDTEEIKEMMRIKRELRQIEKESKKKKERIEQDLGTFKAIDKKIELQQIPSNTDPKLNEFNRKKQALLASVRKRIPVSELQEQVEDELRREMLEEELLTDEERDQRKREERLRRAEESRLEKEEAKLQKELEAEKKAKKLARRRRFNEMQAKYFENKQEAAESTNPDVNSKDSLIGESKLDWENPESLGNAEPQYEGEVVVTERDDESNSDEGANEIPSNLAEQNFEEYKSDEEILGAKGDEDEILGDDSAVEEYEPEEEILAKESTFEEYIPVTKPEESEDETDEIYEEAEDFNDYEDTEQNASEDIAFQDYRPNKEELNGGDKIAETQENSQQNS
eukprot:TRINITY_DN3298_c0_g1_i1.p1 TRINITY_DN3298_c0_g1~~TRINITY_DN3298_c0_g1_i1.p1  ORF type:complete len:425 (+),score=107.67 TRINITY_DN3298_c0_g1_i1:59-1276(+)